MVSASFWCPLDAGNAPRSGRTCCGSNRKNAAVGGAIARRACCPEWGQTFRKESFQSGEAAKDLILFVRSRHCGELNRGLQNLDSFFEKGFNFVSAKLWFCALIRGLQNLELPARETACHFLRRAKSNQKARGTPSCDLDSNLRSIRDFGENGRRSSCNRPHREPQGFRVSPVRI